MTLGLFVAAALVAVLLLAVIAILHWSPDAWGDDHDSPEGSDPDGGLKRPPSPSEPPCPGGVEPVGWARFERDFAAYVAEMRVRA